MKALRKITLSETVKPLLLMGLKHELDLLNSRKAELEQAVSEIENEENEIDSVTSAPAITTDVSTKVKRTYNKSGKPREKKRKVIRGMQKRIVDILAKADRPLACSEIAVELKAENRKDYFKVSKTKITSSIAAMMAENMKAENKVFERVQDEGRFVYSNIKS